MPGTDSLKHTRSPFFWRILAMSLILCATLLRILYLMFGHAIDLSPDEAHYWDWSRHLDWSYYSKGPLVAWLIRASCELFGNEMFAVRLPAILCGALTLVGLYRLTLLVFRRDSLACGVVAACLTMPLIHAGSVLMTIDAPFICAWTWALVAGYFAIIEERRWAWPMLGIIIAIGILSKYTMLLVPGCMVLFLLMTPGYRRTLISLRFLSMIGIASLGWVPIVVWNIQHDWVSFRHVATQAGVYEFNVGKVLFRWNGPLVMLGGQFALLLGFWFVVWILALFRFSPWREPSERVRYLWWCSFPVFATFAGFSFLTGVQANWPAPAYLAGLILAVAWLSEHWTSRLVRVGLVASSIFGLIASGLIYDFRPVRPLLVALSKPPSEEQPLPARWIDPTCRARGWRELAEVVDQCRDAMRMSGQEPFLLASGWNTPGELGFYCKEHPQAYTFGKLLGDRSSQYDLWHPNPIADAQAFVGKSFVYVGPQIPLMELAFERFEGPNVFEYCEENIPLARWQVWKCYGCKGFDLFEGWSQKNRY